MSLFLQLTVGEIRFVQKIHCRIPDSQLIESALFSLVLFQHPLSRPLPEVDDDARSETFTKSELT